MRCRVTKSLSSNSFRDRACRIEPRPFDRLLRTAEIARKGVGAPEQLVAVEPAVVVDRAVDLRNLGRPGGVDRSRRAAGERGVTMVGFIFFSCIIGAFLYVIFRVAPFYYNYYEILGLMEEQASKAGVLTDMEIRDNIVKRIRQLHIPIGREDNLRLSHMGKKMRIEFQYREVLDIDFHGYYYKLWVFDFHPIAERQAARY